MSCVATCPLCTWVGHAHACPHNAFSSKFSGAEGEENPRVPPLHICETLMLLLFLYTFCLDAIRRFFQTKVEEAALKEKGTYDTKVAKQRRRNRIMKVNLQHLSSIILPLMAPNWSTIFSY